MKCYITGAKGFIAGYLIKYLEARGDTIVGTIDAEGAISIPADTDIVYHLGALVRPQESQSRRIAYFAANVVRTLEVLENAPPNAKVVLFGSGGQDHLDSWYGYTKQMAELCGEAYAKFDNLKVYRLRLLGVTGVGKTGDAISDFAEQAATAGRIKHGKLDGFRDINDVRDVVPAIVQTVQNEVPGMYHIGRGTPTSIEFIAKWFGVPLEQDESRFRKEDLVHVSPVASVKGRPIEETLEWVYQSWKERVKHG